MKAAIAPGTARDPECRVHVAATAGDPVLRLIMLAEFYLYRAGPKSPTFDAWFLRKDDCCVECAIKWIKENVRGDNTRYAHVALIT